MNIFFNTSVVKLLHIFQKLKNLLPTEPSAHAFVLDFAAAVWKGRVPWSECIRMRLPLNTPPSGGEYREILKKSIH